MPFLFALDRGRRTAKSAAAVLLKWAGCRPGVVFEMDNQCVCGAGALPAGEAAMSKAAVRDYFDRLAPGWDAELVADSKKIHAILDAAGVKPGARVLDVACGTGVLFPFYLQRGVAGVLAVDLSPAMAAIARSKATGPIRVVCDDVEEMAGTGEYDCCVVYNAFPHFPDPERLIGGLAAWLRPGGRLTVAHGMSVEQLNAHHAGSAAKVSRGMLPAPELAERFRRWFRVDVVVSDGEKYIVSGVLKPKAGAGEAP